MHVNLIKLKIKAKELASESVYNKKECTKLKNQKRTDDYRTIYEHRVNVVRAEARATELARAFIANKPYTYVETFSKNETAEDRWYKIRTSGRIYESFIRMIVSYGNTDLNYYNLYTTTDFAKKRFEHNKAEQIAKSWFLGSETQVVAAA